MREQDGCRALQGWHCPNPGHPLLTTTPRRLSWSHPAKLFTSSPPAAGHGIGTCLPPRCSPAAPFPPLCDLLLWQSPPEPPSSRAARTQLSAALEHLGLCLSCPCCFSGGQRKPQQGRAKDSDPGLPLAPQAQPPPPPQRALHRKGPGIGKRRLAKSWAFWGPAVKSFAFQEGAKHWLHPLAAK